MSLEKLRRKLEQNVPLTVTDYQQLAAHCLAALDVIAAILVACVDNMQPNPGRCGRRKKT